MWAEGRSKSFQVPVQLAIGMPTEVVNHREDDFSGRTLKNDVLPKIWPTAAMRQQEGFTNELTKLGDFLLVVEHEFSRPADRFQVEVHRQQAGSNGLKSVLTPGSQVSSSSRVTDLVT